MSGNEIRQNSDDEISLIDLFVVMLKYRKLIITVVVLGIIAGVCFYVVQTGRSRQITRAPAPAERYEGSMTVMINSRLGMGGADMLMGGADMLPAWFDSKEVIAASIKDAGLPIETISALMVTYKEINEKNSEVNIALKPVMGEKAQIAKLFSLLLDNAEILAAAYYRRYAEDMVSYVESGRYNISGVDYVRYLWTKDFLAGNDTVLMALYPPVVSESIEDSDTTDSGQRGSPRMLSLLIVIASLFFAVFLAFVLNAIKNISGDSEAMTKIRKALGKDRREM
jgi:hypothetical protein